MSMCWPGRSSRDEQRGVDRRHRVMPVYMSPSEMRINGGGSPGFPIIA